MIQSSCPRIKRHNSSRNSSISKSITPRKPKPQRSSDSHNSSHLVKLSQKSHSIYSESFFPSLENISPYAPSSSKSTKFEKNRIIKDGSISPFPTSRRYSLKPKESGNLSFINFSSISSPARVRKPTHLKGAHKSIYSNLHIDAIDQINVMETPPNEDVQPARKSSPFSEYVDVEIERYLNNCQGNNFILEKSRKSLMKDSVASTSASGILKSNLPSVSIELFRPEPPKTPPPCSIHAKLQKNRAARIKRITKDLKQNIIECNE
ncbi:unnamed protein product [Blepharisma stoltei]|uniref:Uncharacterized protein n=1 Tax=Blepharisma stoltei TaxID=1481888 RepID=A0AAU9INP9_9CILI|nr:unnamed protein product [Blepharisma stoltei]